MSDDTQDPLNRLFVDKNEIDREKLASGIEGIVGVDSDSGEVALLPEYYNLDNKQKFAALLLYRRAILAMDIIQGTDLGESSTWFANHIDVSSRSIQNYGNDLDFVEYDEDTGGYFIPQYAIDSTIGFLEHEGS